MEDKAFHSPNTMAIVPSSVKMVGKKEFLILLSEEKVETLLSIEDIIYIGGEPPRRRL
jgi:hypothetical protein